MKKFISLILIVFCCALMFGCDNPPEMFTRSATDSDIKVKYNDDFSIDFKAFITPNTDIKDLQVKFDLLNSKYAIVKSIIKVVGDVKSGQTYTCSVSLSEVGFIDAFKVIYFRVFVNSGQVSYFA